MKILVGFTLLAACYTLALSAGVGNGVRLSKEERDFANQLLPYQDVIRDGITSSFFGQPGRPKPQAGLTCTACRAALMTVLDWIRRGVPQDTIASRLITICKLFKLIGDEVCDAAVHKYIGICLQIFHQRSWLNRIDVCGMILGGGTDQDCRAVNETMTNWDIDINNVKPHPVERPLLPDDIPKTKVLHLADIHLDLHYTQGSYAPCDNHLCCRPSKDDDPSNNATAAGPWGDYRYCDMPIHAVEHVFHDAATRHSDAEFIIMTGDITHHHIWTYTQEDNLAHYNSVFNLIRQEFGDKTIYPVVGNHEPSPCNLFPTREITALMPEHDMSWVYNSLADEFSRVLPPSALETFRRSGYYTLLHRPGFRIISINTNFCYNLNFWLIHSPHDPEGQLQWLSDTLEEAEKNNELVWIIGHVPPGTDHCWYYWGQMFNKIINRYEGIIRAQFYGHTHNDEIRIFFDMNENQPRPTGSLYISTSVTPYSFINPGYKVFYADGVENDDKEATWEIVDYETWIYNVTDANLRGEAERPVIFKEYSAKEMYGVKSFRPADLYELVEKMASDDETFQKYYRLWHMSYDAREECTTIKCKLEFLCPVVITDYSEINCERLEEIMRRSVKA